MTRFRQLATLALAPELRDKLTQHGYLSGEDLDGVGPVELGRELGIGKEDALSILDAIRDGESGHSVGTSVLQLLQPNTNDQETGHAGNQHTRIGGCRVIDGVLGVVGLPKGKITELCGAPGQGKTQIW